jgi:GNAT superfamily N-acetyltransferase
MDNLVIRKALKEDLAAILALYADFGDILDASAAERIFERMLRTDAGLPQLCSLCCGKQMMQFAMEQCKQAGCYKLMLSSNLKREAAHKFYESLGFQRHGYSFQVLLGE